MARWIDADEDWDDDAGDDSESENDDPDDPAEDSDEEPTQACPYCRREIHEDALRCPYCEQYLSSEDAPPSRKPWWLVIGTLACLYAVYRWVVGR